MRKQSLWLWTLVSLPACGNPQALAARCDPVGLPLAPSVSLEALPGGYTIRFVALSGPRAGDTATAYLELREQESALRAMGDGSAQVAVGELDLPPGRLGVADIGDPLSGSDSLPGVGVYVTGRAGATLVTARIGALANAHGPTAFDGAWFTLFFEKADGAGLAGSWSSGVSPTPLYVPEAHGRFCADRTS